MNGWLLAALAVAALTALAFGVFVLYHRSFDRKARGTVIDLTGRRRRP